MFLTKIKIPEYKILKDIDINLVSLNSHNVFPVISYNGGGKSTLLQLIFGLLNFSFEPSKHTYLRNLLSYFNQFKLDNEKLREVAYFELQIDDKPYFIKYLVANKSYKGINFDVIIKLAELKELVKKNYELLNDLELLNKLEADFTNSNISSEVLFHEIRRFITNEREESIIRRGDVKTILKHLNIFKNKIESSILHTDEINKSLLVAEAENTQLENQLKKLNLNYAFHFNKNETVLLYETDLENLQLKKISSNVFLASPKTQVMHFLDPEEVNSLFKMEKYFYSSYDRYITNCQENVKEYFTYDFSTINLIVRAFQRARDNDFKKALETGNYGNEISKSFIELNNLLENKTISIDNELKNLSFKNSKNLKLTPSDLSHGELKKLSIYIWLKANIPEGSIVLFDEIDMGLHPKWQQDIYNDIQTWNPTNQYFLATHSPQIISNSRYKNLVVLDFKANFTTSKQFNEAPVDSDLNSIVKTIMGAEYIPLELQKLREEYRLLFDKNLEETKEGQKLKLEIMNYESQNSSFFQELHLKKLLR